MPYDEEDPPYFEPGPELNALTHAVIGAAIEVHKALGAGLDEETYDNALFIELNRRWIPFAHEVIVDVMYKGEKVGNRRIDYIVGGILVLELKAVENLAVVHMAQVRTYLKLTRIRLGLLINFNTAILKDGIKRIISA